MVAFVITADTNIDALAAKVGGDTYDTNGFILTIDQDSRVGLNQTTSTSLGSMTVNANKGGQIVIDGSAVWMIPYTLGSGTVPAFNTLITNGTGTGKLIGVHATLVAASTASGAVMPATGFLRVKQKTGTYAAGMLIGVTATASDAGRIGWIEVVGDEAGTINANRLGLVNIVGAWHDLGLTNGVSSQTLQIPSNGLLRHAAGVYIEKTAGSADYEFYPNAGLVTAVGVEAARGKVVWISNAGLVRIGNSGAATNGFTPVTGLNVVIGNVFLENCTTAARTANVIPNPALATRYDFTTTGGGVIQMNKVNAAWYLSFAQAYSVSLVNVCTIDAIAVSEVVAPMNWTSVGVGNKTVTALLTSALNMSLCFGGGTFTECVWARVSQATAAANNVTVSDISGFTFVRDKTMALTIRGNVAAFGWNVTRAVNCTWTNAVAIQSPYNFVTCSNIAINGVSYVDCISGTTVVTYVMSIFTLGSGCDKSLFSGISIPILNTHPYGSFLTIGACSNTTLRVAGTRAAPVNAGSVNIMGSIYNLTASSAADLVRIQRIFTTALRSTVMTEDNSSKLVYEENVNCAYAALVGAQTALNKYRKGVAGAPNATAGVGVYGTHWSDYFTSLTVGSILIMMNEPNNTTTTQAVLSGGAGFTSTGGLYMPNTTATAIFESPYFILGHTGFGATGMTMAGGAIANYKFRIQIDKNDGLGYSAWSVTTTSATLNAELAAIVGINPSRGFKLKLEVVTLTANTTPFTSISFATVSTDAAQNFFYPLDILNLTLSGIKAGSDVVILQAGTTNVLTAVDSTPGTSWPYTYETPQAIDIGVLRAGYIPFYIRNYNLTNVDASVPVAQLLDRNQEL